MLEVKMNKICAIGDVHGNYQALEAAVNYAIENGVKVFVFTGDYGSDFLQMHECLGLIRKVQSRYPTWVIKGNCEEDLINYDNSTKTSWKYGTTGGVLLETYKSLTEEDMDYIKKLPSKAVVKIPNQEPIFVTHDMSSLTSFDMDTIAKNKVKHVLCGHTHNASVMDIGGLSFENPGSMGLTNDAVASGGTIGIYERNNDGGWNYSTKKVYYDSKETLDKINSNHMLTNPLECSYWDVLLAYSVFTGKNLTADYVAELHRLDLICRTSPDFNIERFKPLPYELFNQIKKNDVVYETNDKVWDEDLPFSIRKQAFANIGSYTGRLTSEASIASVEHMDEVNRDTASELLARIDEIAPPRR